MSCFRLGRMLKIWNVNRLAREMPSSLLTEWIAFMRLEDEEMKKRQLEGEATDGVKQMREKRQRGRR